MNTETQQLGDIYNDLMNQFVNHPLIRVEAVKGNPPEQYEVTYNLLCTVQGEGGQIEKQRGHTVVITIPFGFPHFPPSCKPKTAIFHPDFDSAAICLGDFWQNNRDLAELIRHIGTMLAGEVYSQENAFNEEAAAWFHQHADELPFEKTGLSQKGWSPTDSPGPSTQQNTDKLALDLDILEDTDFAETLGSLEQRFSPGKGQAGKHDSAAQQSREKSEHLWELSRKKRFFQLKKELDGLDFGENIDGQEALLQKANAALTEARNLFQEADEEECQGSMEKAAGLYASVAEKVTDFPEIATAQQRVKKSLAMLSEFYSSHSGQETAGTPTWLADTDSFTGASLPPGATIGDTPNLSIADKSPPAKIEQPPSPPPEKVKKKITIGAVPIAAFSGLLLIAGFFAYLYLSSNTTLQQAGQLLGQCKQAMAAKDFMAAERTCLAALDASKSVFFTLSEQRAVLQKESQAIIDSEELRQGLLGNILLDGRYIPKAVITQQKEFQAAVDAGKAAIAANQWNEAASQLRKALSIEEAYRDIQVDSVLVIEQELAFAETRLALQNAEKSIAKNSQADALSHLLQAQKSVAKVSPEIRENLSGQISALLTQRQFTELKQQADQLFAKSDWAGAYSLFQKAMQIGRELSAAKPQELNNLQINVSRAALYSTIEDGNRAFSNGQWDTAISRYTDAKEQLKGNEAGFSPADLNKNREKLERILLQSVIIRDRQKAEAAIARKETLKAQQLLQEVVQTIKNSQFAKEAEFSEIASDASSKLRVLKEDIFIQEKVEYLTKNYKSLFIQHYPATKAEVLSNPKITFDRKIDQLYLFQMRCNDSRGGRRLTLEMYYTFDPVSGAWKFRSDP